MSNAPQGPGWWQASDGNWYPPEQHPSYAPPPPTAPSAPPGYQPAGQAPSPPPGPQSWSAPAAYPQYPAPGGQTFGNAQAAFTGGAAKLPLAAWLLFAGLAVDLISGLLPTWTVSANGETHSIGSTGGGWVLSLLGDGVMAVLVWATFARPRRQLGTLIALTVLVGLAVLAVIVVFTVNVPKSSSPGAGLFLDAAGIVILVVGIIMAWTSRSKAQPQAY